MKSYFVKLFDYNLWANKAFIAVLEQQTFTDPKILTLLSHTANAQIIWLDRVNGKVSQTAVWEEYALPEAIELLMKGSHDWINMLKNLDDLDLSIGYHNSKGVSFSSPITDILVHVANHGTHHRGQIATLLRVEGISPPASDFIFFCRA